MTDVFYMDQLKSLIKKTSFSRQDLAALLATADLQEIETIRQAAETVLLEHCGNAVHLRGLIEASNACSCDCHYCGIRKSNREVGRYTLAQEEILDCARLCAELGYGSMVIQSGERSDKKFIDLIARTVEQIKCETRSDKLPEGLGITLCIGQQTRETYRRLFDAGAHRYLLRIETTNPELFSKIHPPKQSLEARIECLHLLRDVGYQVGTGVMIGLPGQTLEDLADDLLFFKELDADMFGMGPYIPHPGTPLASEACPPVEERMRLGLLRIAALRLLMKDVNIASTTALQTLDPFGREKGLAFGANVLMPQTTPSARRADYLLYPGKSNIDENALTFRKELEERVVKVGRTLVMNNWGDAPHAKKRGAGRHRI